MTLPRLLCIHSLTAHGVVGLKPFLAELGAHCLPVPSLLLSGPGNMPGCERFPHDFAGLLRGTLAAARDQGARVTLFVGYLRGAEQVDVIRAALADFRAAIDAVWVDPVCGDHGRAYVAADLIAAWPALLAEADWVFPNLTEAELLSGLVGDDAMRALRARFPRANFVFTGLPSGGEIETRLCLAQEPARAHLHRQRAVPGRFNGTGDLFAASFARALLLEGREPAAAMAAAATAVAAALERTLADAAPDASPPS